MLINRILKQQLANTCLLLCSLCICAMTVYSQEGCIVGNPIVMENTCNEGTTSWQIPMAAGIQPPFQPSTNNGHEVEGYADKTSVNAGEQIRFHINLHNPPPAEAIAPQVVTIDIYRLGWYSGTGGRLVYSTQQAGVGANPLPAPNLEPGTPEQPNASPNPIPETGMGLAECNWPSTANSYWNVPANATSGIYLVKLTRVSTGHQSYISFAVRRDDLNSDLLFQQSVTVYQAYNDYPGYYSDIANYPTDGELNGKSLYGSYGPAFGNGTTQARKVSFNRPYIGYSNFGIYESAGLGFFNYEYPLIRWLERNGYYVTYATDIDTHTSPGILASYKHQALLSNGHDEYWSWNMRKNVEDARDRPNSGGSKPINIGFFGANISYWQIRLSKSTFNTQPANAANRSIVCYKENLEIPLYGDPYRLATSTNDPFGFYSLRHLTTSLWRDNHLWNPAMSYPPEDEMLGIMTIKSYGDLEHPPTTHNGGQPIFGAGSNPFKVVLPEPMDPPLPLPWYAVGAGNQQMPNMIGYESDELYTNHVYPDRNLTVVGSSPFLALRPPNGNQCGCDSRSCGCVLTYLGNAETTFYKKPSNGAKVFAASGQQWSWGLDNWGADPNVGPVISSRPASATADASTITKNVMDCLINQNTACN